MIFGTQSSAVCAGGSAPGVPANPTDVVEEYDGTSWSTSTALSATRKLSSDAGTSSLGLVGGGHVATNASQTSGEEWTKPTIGHVITVS